MQFETEFPLNSTEPSESERRRNVRNRLLLLKGLLALFLVWFPLYATGIFPYLGEASKSRQVYENYSTFSESGLLAVDMMFLVEGQTAFFDYEVKSETGREMQLDLRPFPGFVTSDEMVRIAGDAKGRVEFVVPETGLYHFHHDLRPYQEEESIQYTVTWGAY